MEHAPGTAGSSARERTHWLLRLLACSDWPWLWFASADRRAVALDVTAAALPMERVRGFQFIKVPPTDAAIPLRLIEDAEPDLMDRIFGYLDPRAMGCAGAVSRRWRRAAHEDAAWERICRRSFPILVALRGLAPRPWRQLYIQRANAEAPPAVRAARHKVLRRDDYMVCMEIRDVGQPQLDPPVCSVLKKVPCGDSHSAVLLEHEIAKGFAMDEEDNAAAWDYLASGMYDVHAYLVRISDAKCLSLGSFSANPTFCDTGDEHAWDELVWEVPGMPSGMFIYASFYACVKKADAGVPKLADTFLLTRVNLTVRNHDGFPISVAEMLTEADGFAFKERWA